MVCVDKWEYVFNFGYGSNALKRSFGVGDCTYATDKHEYKNIALFHVRFSIFPYRVAFESIAAGVFKTRV